MRRACASDSMTHGPAIKNNWPPPTWTGPISKEGLTDSIVMARSASRQGVLVICLSIKRQEGFASGEYFYADRRSTLIEEKNARSGGTHHQHRNLEGLASVRTAGATGGC